MRGTAPETVMSVVEGSLRGAMVRRDEAGIAKAFGPTITMLDAPGHPSLKS